MILQTPSPNFNDRAQGAVVRFIVLHYTGMKTAEEARGRLRDPSSEVSTHYLIDEEGNLSQLVAENKRAWHAGQSFWRGQTDLNSFSIGIELVNKGHEFGYTPFPLPQIKALIPLLEGITQRYRLPPAALLAHSDIAPERKEDPGELFPWQELAAHGLGLWPEPKPENYEKAASADCAALLSTIGYDTRTPQALIAARTAFLRRYHPARLSSGFDDESAARLHALARGGWAKAARRSIACLGWRDNALV